MKSSNIALTDVEWKDLSSRLWHSTHTDTPYNDSKKPESAVFDILKRAYFCLLALLFLILLPLLFLILTPFDRRDLTRNCPYFHSRLLLSFLLWESLLLLHLLRLLLLSYYLLLLFMPSSSSYSCNSNC